MTIKNLFDDLKQVGKKCYHSRNDEEALSFGSNSFLVEIFRCAETIDVIINVDGTRNHYLDSPYLSYDEKANIRSALSAITSGKVMASTISKTLLYAFSRIKHL